MSVLIIADKEDNSFNHVIEWLKNKNVNYLIINFIEFYNGFNFSLSFYENILTINLVNEKPFVVKSIWFRSDTVSQPSIKWANFAVEQSVKSNLFWEVDTLKSGLFSNLKYVKQLSEYSSIKLNKLNVLKIANQIGFDIPESILTNNKNVLIEFKSKFGNIVCKSSFENISHFKTQNGFLKNFVDIVDNQIVDILPDVFFPSFFQKLIPKEFDVRVFFLDGKIYSMAIFSGSVDYRADYSLHRNVPLKLPKILEILICELMEHLNLNTGSLDFIKSSEDGRFYFLEVNPNGQFSMVSEPCNYYIEREIANFLCYEE